MATELGKAYVQIMPSAKGISGKISGVLGPEAESAGKAAGESVGGKLLATLRNVLIAAGIGKIIKDAVFAGGALEQSLGGVETLFKDSAETVKKHAQDAYMTAGVSANTYMENVTSFSASLLQSLGGDTAKAAEVSNMAMIDMADNSNKMGTAMQDIQNAYQGFAKQNYTMLDNLKLGYGGTKKEMERLLADAEKLTGVEYDIENLSDVYNAIHVIQEELDITGTTAIEASDTFLGSMNAMKASAENLLGALATGQDWSGALEGLTSTVVTFAKNLIPMVADVVRDLPVAIIGIIKGAGPELVSIGALAIADLASGLGSGLPLMMTQGTEAILGMLAGIVEALPALIEGGLQIITGLAEGIMASVPIIIEQVPLIIDGLISAIGEGFPLIVETGISLLTALIDDLPTIITTIVKALPKIIEGITKLFSDNIPLLVETGIELLTALVEALPEIIAAIVDVLPEIIDSIVTTLLNNIQLLINAGVQLLTALIDNMPTILMTLIGAMPQIITSITTTLTNNIPAIIQTGVQLLTALITNLPAIIVKLVTAMPQIITSLVKALGQGVASFVSMGGELLLGLAKGIAGAVSGVIRSAINAVSGVVNSVKSFFGIRSPSRVFMQIGEMLDAGLAKGIADNTKPITQAMDSVQEITNRDFESDIAMNAIMTGRLQGSHDFVATNKQDGKSLNLVLSLAGHTFSAFVDDITKLQDRAVELELAY